jgi:hypothetical protein
MDKVNSTGEEIFSGFRRADESVPAWLQRVVAAPVTRFDPQIVQDKFNDIDNRRRAFDERKFGGLKFPVVNPRYACRIARREVLSERLLRALTTGYID